MFGSIIPQAANDVWELSTFNPPWKGNVKVGDRQDVILSNIHSHRDCVHVC